MLRARHGRADFSVATQAEMLGTLSNILGILTMAVGIVTSMTISVAKRTPAVGLPLAPGSRRGTILRLFLGEAVVLALLGSLLGVAVGFGLAMLIRLFVPALPVSTPLLYVLLTVASSTLIGLLGGVLPARRKARLDPVDALRSE